MYTADWFESEFMSSLFSWFCQNHTDEDGKEKPCFISAKQFNVFAKNSDMLMQDSYDVATRRYDNIHNFLNKITRPQVTTNQQRGLQK